MSAYVTVCCDADINGARCMVEDSPLGDPKTATLARRHLSKAPRPWHRTRDGRDICPDCWEAGRR